MWVASSEDCEGRKCEACDDLSDLRHQLYTPLPLLPISEMDAENILATLIFVLLEELQQNHSSQMSDSVAKT